MTDQDEVDAVDLALKDWRQGDVSLDAGLGYMHLADLARAHSPASLAYVADLVGPTGTADLIPVFEEVEGVVMLTQTCDIVRPCIRRPFVEVAPLAGLNEKEVEEVRLMMRPSFAYVPAMAVKG